MIELLQARTGRTILRQDGVLLASMLDPEREAREWLARRKEFLPSLRSVIVLGAGSGYHLETLAHATRAKILVVENNAERVQAVQELHGFRSVEFILINKLKELRSNDKIREAIKQSFTVLRHPPSTVHSAPFFRDIQSFLLGRDWASLNWQWGMKGAKPLNENLKIDGVQGDLTIYDLDDTELVKDSAERERMLIKALRELVK